MTENQEYRMTIHVDEDYLTYYWKDCEPQEMDFAAILLRELEGVPEYE